MEVNMQRLVFISLMVLIGTTGPAVADFWVSQDPTTKNCKIVEQMPDGKTQVMIGATSYPTREAAKAAKDVAVRAGECVKKPDNP
jgi:hypothetical protein